MFTGLARCDKLEEILEDNELRKLYRITEKNQNSNDERLILDKMQLPSNKESINSPCLCSA